MLLGVDVGGTFTDAVLVGQDGRVHTAKVATTPAQQSTGVLHAVRAVLARAGAHTENVTRFAHGMTVATNALLEGRTARTALIATAGFTDVIELGRQNRAHLYRLALAAPPPLVTEELRFGAPERIAPEGELSPPPQALDPAAARELVEHVLAAAPEAVAVSLLHSYADPAHELMLGQLLHELAPALVVSLSCQLVGTFREYERTATTVLDAALSPLLGSYLGNLCREAALLGLSEPHIMQSSGGLTDASHAAQHAALTVLSGPAGGVGGAQLLARAAGEQRVLCFDMGGTSCDVCLIDGADVPETAERTVAGRPVALPSLDIHTVGAGGGSIAWRDAGGALRVGPQSAGALPGPACYGHGGQQPTVTDANLLLGRLLEDSPLAGGLQLSRAAAQRAVGELARRVGLEPLACAEGIVRVAEAEMLGALRLMTVERGIDPRRFALMPFGGAGPLHAAALARQLGIRHILCPRASGVLSALGLAAAAPRRDLARTVALRGTRFTAPRLDHERATLVTAVLNALPEHAVRLRVTHELRYRGQSFELPVEENFEGLGGDGGSGGSSGSGGDGGSSGDGRWGIAEVATPLQLRAGFELAHEQRYGYRDSEAEVELVTIRASAWGAAPLLAPLAEPGELATADVRRLMFDGQPCLAAVFRGEPPPGATIPGPSLCALSEATLLIPPGWHGEVDALGTIHLHAASEGAHRSELT